MKTKNFLSIIIITLLFLLGCQQNIVEDDVVDVPVVEDDVVIVGDDDVTGNIPILKIFGQADVDIKVLDIIKSANSVNVNAKIITIKDYVLLESKETLLDEGEDISLYFSGVGNPDEWKTNQLSEGMSVNLEIRCLDGRTNSKDPFTKESCYWEADEMGVEVI